MTLYIGTATNPQMQVENQSISSFLRNYQPQQLNLPESKEELRAWKQNYMKCLLSGEMIDAKRNNENIVGRDVVALDLDYICVDNRQQLIHELENSFPYTSFLYPSVSCSSNNLRYRLIVPISECITTQKQYKNITRALLQNLIDNGILTKIDNSNLTWSQIFGLPIITQFTPEADKENLIHEFHKKELSLHEAFDLGEKYQQLNAKPKNQAMLNLAQNYIEDNNSDDDYIKLIQSFANRNREWLNNYNNYLACQFEIKYAEMRGEINHDMALQMVSILALDEDMARANQEKYEREKRVKQHGMGLAYFVSKDQVKSRIDWLSFDHTKKQYVIRFKKLADKVLSETHYTESSLFKNGAIIYDNNSHKWIDEEAGRILERKVTKMLDKAGVWNNRNYRDALTFIKANSFKNFNRNPFDCGNPYEIVFNNVIFNVKEFQTIENTPNSMIPNYHHNNFRLEWFDNDCKLKQEYYPETTVKWLKSLLKDDGAVDYLITLIGYCFIRTYNDSPVVTVLYGRGNNGKSTLLRYISNLIGFDNLASATIQQLGNDNLRFVSSKLYHKEANIFADTGDSIITNFDKIKALSGGDSILAEYKGRDMFDFTNYAKLIFSTNKLPKFKDFSPAVRRRLRVIEFSNNFDEKTTKYFNQNFPLETIYNEQEKMIALSLQYLHDFLQGKTELLSNSQKMKSNVNKWINDNDTDGAFMDKFVVKDDKAHLYGKTKTGESIRNLYNGYLIINSYYENDSLKRKDFLKLFDGANNFIGKSKQSSSTKRLENVVFSPMFFEEVEFILKEMGNPYQLNLTNCVYYDKFLEDDKYKKEKSWEV